MEYLVLLQGLLLYSQMRCIWAIKSHFENSCNSPLKNYSVCQPTDSFPLLSFPCRWEKPKTRPAVYHKAGFLLSPLSYTWQNGTQRFSRRALLLSLTDDRNSWKLPILPPSNISTYCTIRICHFYQWVALYIFYMLIM